MLINKGEYDDDVVGEENEAKCERVTALAGEGKNHNERI